MTRYLLISAIPFLSGCDKGPPAASSSHGFKVENAPSLTPQDLGIEKRQLRAMPGPGEVAVFRARRVSRLEPHEQMTLDHIQWTNGKEAIETVLIAPLSFYLGYPDSKGAPKEAQFRDSWRMRAGHLNHDINDHCFLKSEWNTYGDRAEGKVAYTKNFVTQSEDLVFEFGMFVISLAEAGKRYPDLDLKGKKDINGSWKAVFQIDPKGDPVPLPQSPGDESTGK